MILYKFTHTPLLKNDDKLKQKKQSPNLLKNNIHVQLNKKKEKQNKYHAKNLGNKYIYIYIYV